MEAGDVLTIPPFLASASFDMDLDVDHTMVGCIAVLMEEDETPQSSIVLGRIAYAKEIETQLNELVHKRLVAGDFGPFVTDAETSSRSVMPSTCSSPNAFVRSWPGPLELTLEFRCG